MADDVGVEDLPIADHSDPWGRLHDESFNLPPFGLKLSSVGWGSAVCLARDYLLGASFHRYDPAVGPPFLQWLSAICRNAENAGVGANKVLARPHVGVNPQSLAPVVLELAGI